MKQIFKLGDYQIRSLGRENTICDVDIAEDEGISEAVKNKRELRDILEQRSLLKESVDYFLDNSIPAD